MSFAGRKLRHLSLAMRRACHALLPFAAMQGQRPGNKPAQGNALGRTIKTAQALKGRHILCSALSGLWIFFHSDPGRCPGLACLRTFGAHARRGSKCMTGFSSARHILCSALSGLWIFFHSDPGRCPGLACLRTFGAHARRGSKCMTGFSSARVHL